MIAVTRRSTLALLLGICLAWLAPAAALAAPYSGGSAPSSGSSSGGVSASSGASSSGAASSGASSSGASSSGASPPSSAAQGAFGVGLPQSSAPTPTQTQASVPLVTTSANNAGGSLSSTDALLVAVGAIVVLAVIAYFIWSDSRHRVRALRHAATAGGSNGGPNRGSKAPPKSRKLTPAERRRRKRGRARAR